MSPQTIACYALTANRHVVDGKPQKITALVVEKRQQREMPGHPVAPLELQASGPMELAETPWGWVCADGQVELLNIDPKIAEPWWPQFVNDGILVFQVEHGFTPGQHPLPKPFVRLKANGQGAF